MQIFRREYALELLVVSLERARSLAIVCDLADLAAIITDALDRVRKEKNNAD